MQTYKIISENDLFYSRWDDFPASKGHALIAPKKHIKSYFDLTKAIIDEKFKPDAYNIGINEGEAAGRTVHHLRIST